MGNFGKWIGGGLGWALGGPIGAIAGFVIGTLYDNAPDTSPYSDTQKRVAGKTKRRTRAGDFGVSLLVLSAAVMKADGKVLKSELDYVKVFFNRQFGAAETRELLKVLREMLKQDIPLKEVCDQIRYNMKHPLRLQLLHYLFGIAGADGNVHATEANTIHQIASYLGINRKDFESIKAMFYEETDSAYRILEINKSASNDEVKKAYRKMAVKYHPDKVANLGEDFQKAAKEKFQKVQDAYEKIKKERGMS